MGDLDFRGYATDVPVVQNREPGGQGRELLKGAVHHVARDVARAGNRVQKLGIRISVKESASVRRTVGTKC